MRLFALLFGLTALSCAHADNLARRDGHLQAVVRSRKPLVYAAGADPSLDRRPHVRAGSGIAASGGRLYVIQDDASFIATIDVATASVTAVPLPSPDGVRTFEGDRKKEKLDLESCVIVRDGFGRDVLLAFGSGSSPRRNQMVYWDMESPPRLISLPRLYETLRKKRDFSGPELNIEGVALAGKRLRFFQRAVGGKRGGEIPVNSAIEVSAKKFLQYVRNPEGRLPKLKNIERHQLGELKGVKLGFSDAVGFGDRTLFVASAEATAAATSDGAIAGSAVGVIESDGTARWIELTDDQKSVLNDKVEGIALDPSRPGRVYAVTDPDNGDVPAELLEIELVGAW